MKRKYIFTPFIVLSSLIITSSVYATTYNLNGDNSFKSWMPYQAITSKTSKQYAITRSENTKIDKNGLLTYNDRYLVAVGTGLNAPVGTEFTAITSNGRTINCIVGDIKQDRHTGADNITVEGNGNVIEFIVDRNTLNNDIRRSGNVSTLGGIFSGQITSINVNDGSDAVNYADTEMKRQGQNGMPSDVQQKMYGGAGSSYGEYSIKKEGELGYTHWQAFDIEEKEDEEWYATNQMKQAVYFSELPIPDFTDITNGLKIPSSSRCEDRIEDIDDAELEPRTTTMIGKDSGAHLGKPKIKGNGAILDMPTYINQGTCAANSFPRYYYKDKNGKIVASTIAKSGCLDCSIAMMYIYYYGDESTDTTELLTTKISNHVDQTNGSLLTSNVLASLNLQASDKICPKSEKSNGEVIGWKQLMENIDNGNPCLLHIRGQWKDYHTSKNGHFLVATGYDEDGIYVYDPGKRSNTESKKPIPWEDWDLVDDLYYKTYHSTLHP